MDVRASSLAFIIVLYISRQHVTADSGTAQGCGQGWVSDKDKNYCYLFNNQKKVQYASAQTECDGLDSSLLRVKSQSELTWYTGAVVKFPSAGYWTDLNDIPKSPAAYLGTGHWKWGHFTSADISFMSWAKAPSNDGVSNCGGMNIHGKVEDLDCGSQQWWICQYVGSPDKLCGPSWISMGYRCYWVADPNNPAMRLTWADADKKCKAIEPTAYLITLNNADDQTFVRNHLNILTSTGVFWLGLKYTNTNWQWYNGDAYNSSFFSWQKEPDNVAGIEKCGVIRTTGKLSDRDCTQPNNFICKKPMPYYYPSDNIGCGPWIRAGRFCYRFEYSQPKSWSDARADCQTHNADLIKVDSLDKRFWLQQQLMDPAYRHTFWTGLNDRATEGTYVWTDGSAVNIAYINWNREPNDYMGNEDCGLLYNTGQYNDAACSTHAAAICEIDGQNNCPAGWKSRPSDTGATNDCYLFTPYNNVTVVKTQMEASAYCATQSLSATIIAQLLSVNSVAEQMFIKLTVTSMLDNGYGWWTSLNDIQSEGFWAFAQGYQGDKFVDWQGEPSSVSPSWDCAFMNNAGAYHIRDCGGKHGYICERTTNVQSVHGYETTGEPTSAQSQVHGYETTKEPTSAQSQVHGYETTKEPTSAQSQGADSIRGWRGAGALLALCLIVYTGAMKLV